MDELRFSIALKPTPKARPRVTSRGVYTPDQQEFYDAFHYLLPAKLRNAMLEGPLRIDLYFHCQVFRADADNILKLVLDALVHSRVIRDDNMKVVRSLHVTALHDAHEGITVTIRDYDGP